MHTTSHDQARAHVRRWLEETIVIMAAVTIAIRAPGSRLVTRIAREGRISE